MGAKAVRHVKRLTVFGVLAVCLWLGWRQSQAATEALPYLRRTDGAPVWSLAAAERIRLAEAAFTDQRGQAVHVASLRGRPVILDFALAGCEDVCPPKRRSLQALLQRQRRSDLQVVTLVMNRRRVADGILQHLIAETGIPESRWHYWQGADGDVLRYCRTIPHVGPRLATDTAEPGAAHSDNVLLVDAAGYCRGVYHANSPLDVKNLEQDIEHLPTP